MRDEAIRGRDAMDARSMRALRSYAEPGEVPETRVVLARVMERARASESQRRGWWVWGAVAAGLAVVVLVGVLVLRRSRVHEDCGGGEGAGCWWRTSLNG